MIDKRRAWLDAREPQLQPPKILMEPADPDNANEALILLGDCGAGYTPVRTPHRVRWPDWWEVTHQTAADNAGGLFCIRK